MYALFLGPGRSSANDEAENENDAGYARIRDGR